MLALASSGCKPKGCRLEGIVEEEFGTASGIVRSEKTVFSNETVKLRKPTYGIKIKNAEGDYYLEIKEWEKSLLALSEAIEPGDKVEIEYGCLNIHPDKIGNVYSQFVRIIEKGKIK